MKKYTYVVTYKRDISHITNELLFGADIPLKVEKHYAVYQIAEIKTDGLLDKDKRKLLKLKLTEFFKDKLNNFVSINIKKK